MQYFALFLSNNNYVEKCLSVIRLIGNPKASSFPHITLRLFKKAGGRLVDTEKSIITHLNLIRPGNFNIMENTSPFVVYIRCESRELELIEHKPDYPHSRLHITLYEGLDIDYAIALFSLLKKNKWHFKLKFSKPLYLAKKTIGETGPVEEYIRTRDLIFQEITGMEFSYFLKNDFPVNRKLQIVDGVLGNLYQHFFIHPEGCNVESDYCDGDVPVHYETSPDYFIMKSPLLIERSAGSGVFITPPEYAQDMAQCALGVFSEKAGEIDFGDSAVGTGALFLAMQYIIDKNNICKDKKHILRSAIGIDTDKKMVEDALDRFQKRGLHVIYGDALSPNIKLEPRNLMLVNPPYDRHESIPLEYRSRIQELAEQQTGIKIAGDAGLYVYHLLIMDKWLCEGGVAAWLIPSIFLQSRYGEAIRKYLLNNVQLISLHVYDYRAPQFEKAQTSTAIVIFKKQHEKNIKKVRVSFGDSAIRPSQKINIDIKKLKESPESWQAFIPNGNRSSITSDPGLSALTLGDFFDIKRGIATGANSFFVMKRAEAYNWEIPDEALKPLLPKARFLNSFIVNSRSDGYPDTEPQLVLIDSNLDEETIKEKYNKFYKYLDTAKSNQYGKRSILERTLVKSRHPWYRQEKRDPCPFLLTYMGRDKEKLPPLYFVLNKSKAVALNTYLLLYPKEWLKKLIEEDPSICEAILFSLNGSARTLLAPQTRIYSEGLKKIEPGELRKLQVQHFPDKVVSCFTSNQMETYKGQRVLF